MAILGELDRAGLINRDLPTVHATTLGEAHRALGHFPTTSQIGARLLLAAPGGVPTQMAFSQDRRWDDLDLDRENGVIRSAEHPFSKDGGLAVLKGNLAVDGCIVKTAGVDESILKFTGPARVFESQDASGHGHPHQQDQGRATSSSSAMKARAAAPACRRCSIRPAI